MSELRERIARAMWSEMIDPRYTWDAGTEQERVEMLGYADAVIAALGLTERDANVIGFRYDDRSHHWETRRHYVTPWERVDE